MGESKIDKKKACQLEFPVDAIATIFVFEPADLQNYIRYISKYQIRLPHPDFIGSKINELAKEEIQTALFLDLDSRFELIQKLAPIILSDTNYPPEFYAISLIQSFCAIFFVNLQEIDDKILSQFISSFELGIKCLPQQGKLCTDLFMYFLSLLINTTRVFNYLPPIDRVISTLTDSFQAYSTKIIQFLLKVIDLTNFDQIGEMHRGLTDFVFTINNVIDWNIVQGSSDVDEIKFRLLALIHCLEPSDTALQFVFSVFAFSLNTLSTRSEEFDVMCNILDTYLPKEPFHEAPTAMNEMSQLPQAKLRYVKNTKIDNTFSYTSPTTSFKNILGNDHILVKVLDFFLNIGRNYGPDYYQIVFIIFRKKISGGNLYYELLFLLLLQNDDHYHADISEYLNSHSGWTILLNFTLFDPTITIFNDPENKLINLRCLLFDIMGSLSLIGQSSDIFSCFLIFLNSIIDSPALFTESMKFFCDKVIPKINTQTPHFHTFIEIIANELVLQQERAVGGDELSPQYRYVLLQVIESLAENSDFCKTTFLSNGFMKSYFSLIFEVDHFCLVFNIFQKMALQHFLVTPKPYFDAFQNIVSIVIQTITLQLNNPETNNMTNNILVLIQFCVNHSETEFSSLFLNSLMMEEISRLVTVIPPQESCFLVYFNILSALQENGFSPYDKIQWSSFIQPIQSVGLSTEMFRKLRTMVFSSSFESIENIQPLPLMILASKGSEFFMLNLNDLCRVCNNSIWNCFAVFTSGILQKLLELQDISEKELTIVLQIFCLVNTHISSRQQVFQISNQLKPVHTNHLNPHFKQYAECMRKMFTKNYESPTAFFHFCHESEYIEIPSLTLKEMSGVFSFSFWLLIESFPSLKEATSILTFCSPDATLHLYLTQAALWISHSRNKKTSFILNIPFNAPTSQWFNLTIQFDHTNGLTVFINNEQKGTLGHSIDFLPGEYKTIFIQSHPFEPDIDLHWMKDIEISHFAIFLGPTTFQLPSMIENEQMTHSLLSIPTIHSLYGAQKTKLHKIINYVPKSIVKYGKYQGKLCSFLASFIQVFESSNGASFLTTLWPEVLMTYPNGNEEPELVNWIGTIIKELIRMSEISQSQLVKIDAYLVISHFLLEINPDFLTAKTWILFSEHFDLAVNDNLRLSICENILFNGLIWSRAKTEEAIDVFEKWHLFFQKTDYTYWKCVNISYMIEVLSEFLMKSYTQSLDEQKLLLASQTICMSIFQLAKNSFALSDAQIILNFALSLKTGITVLALLKLFEDVFILAENVKPIEYFEVLLNICTQLFFDADESSKIQIIHLFTILQKSQPDGFSIMMLFIHAIRERSVLFERSQAENVLNFLFDTFCCKAIGSQRVTQEYLKGNKQIVDTNSFFLAFFAAFELSPEQKERLSIFVSTATSNEENQIKISKSLTDESVFILTFYSILISNAMIPMMSAILYRSPSYHYYAIRLIDIFEILFQTNLHKQATELITNTLPLLVSNSVNESMSDFFMIFLNFILFHFVDRPKEHHDVTFNHFLSLFQPLMKCPDVKFGILIENDEWTDFKLAKLILQLLLVIISDKPDLVPPNVVSILLYYCSLPSLDFTPMMTLIIQIKNEYKKFPLEPLLHNLSQRKNLESEYIQQLIGSNSVPLDVAQYETTTQIIYNYSIHNPLLPETLLPMLCNIFAMFEHLPCDSNPLFIAPPVFKSDIKFRAYRSWNKLQHKLKRERSPFYVESQTHYKRGNKLDYRFRPMLLNPNYKFNQKLPTKIPVTLMSTDQSESEMIWNYQPKDYSWMARCSKIKINRMDMGKFYVTTNGFVFLSDEGKQVSIPGDSVEYMFYRWYLHVPNSVEFFLNDRRSYFFSFPGEKNHDFFSKLTKVSMHNKIFIQSHSSPNEVQQLHLTEKWLNHSITTFDYLMWLNLLSGRSFNCINCYPVFPWIILDYGSHVFKSENIIYRDFSMPIGAFNKPALDKCKERNASIASDGRTYLYATGYSNSFIVSHYLVRMEPFTSIHVKLQDGKFDNPNRIFQSIPDSFSRLIGSANSFRELVPEFFFLPDFLENSDKFDLGCVQDSVELPVWSSTSVDFIQKHQQALESDACSTKIHHWIDLIWGYQQTGQAAADADNTFDPKMYSNYKSEEDSYVKELIGQIPLQLFDSPHPARQNYIPPKLPTINLEVPHPPSHVLAFDFVFHSIDSYKIYSFHNDGTIISCRTKYQPKLVSENESIPIDPHLVTHWQHQCGFAFVPTDTNGIEIYDPLKKVFIKSNEKAHIAAINCIAASDHFVATGGCDSSVVLWKWSKHAAKFINQSVVHNDIIKSIAIDEGFGIVISCSADRVMTVFTLPSLEFVRTIDFDFPPEYEPNRVLITPGNGNIVIFGEYEKLTMIKSFTINGRLISNIHCEQRVVEAIPVKNQKGYDFLILLNDDDSVTYVDGNYLVPVDEICRYKDSHHIVYHSESQMLMVSTSNTFVFVPFMPI